MKTLKFYSAVLLFTSLLTTSCSDRNEPQKAINEIIDTAEFKKGEQVGAVLFNQIKNKIVGAYTHSSNDIYSAIISYGEEALLNEADNIHTECFPDIAEKLLEIIGAEQARDLLFLRENLMSNEYSLEEKINQIKSHLNYYNSNAKDIVLYLSGCYLSVNSYINKEHIKSRVYGGCEGILDRALADACATGTLEALDLIASAPLTYVDLVDFFIDLGLDIYSAERVAKQYLDCKMGAVVY